MKVLSTVDVRRLATECGFELAGVCAAEPVPDFAIYADWVARGHAGKMRYLTDRRGGMRSDPRVLLPSARSMICVGKLYNGPEPYSTTLDLSERGWISRYAWGEDYHFILEDGLNKFVQKLKAIVGDFAWRICIDTAPLLERSYARRAGLGWIGKNTCLINQPLGSWFFLGEVLLSIGLEADAPPPDRCGSCTRCIDACPTSAIVPEGSRFTIDSRLCIAYHTIEVRGAIAEDRRAGLGSHLFGCDICQDVCPWNRRAPVAEDGPFRPKADLPPLDRLATISEDEFRTMFRSTPVSRARYSGFLRNVAIAMGNSGSGRFREPLEALAGSRDPVVADAAVWALARVAG